MKSFYEKHYLSKGEATRPATVVQTLAELRAPGSRYYCIFDQIAEPGHLSALELGFGYPQISNAMASVFGTYLAIDVAAQAILSGYAGDIAFHYKEADLNEDFPVDTNSVDVVIAMMVIEHLFDPFHSFSEVARICRQGGMAFINLPLITSWKHRKDLLLGRMPTTSNKQWFEQREWDGGHLHYFDVAHVKRLAGLYGLSLLRMYPVGNAYGIKKLLPQLLCGEMSFVFSRD